MKTFTIVAANKQDRQSFETEATTVGELLAELKKRNIDYSGMTLYEGLSKSSFEVTDTDGILPHDVSYTNKRTGDEIITSNLVFMLSTSKKKTSSGAMDRKSLMAAVKAAGLCDAVKEKFGKNYTQVSSKDLEDMLNAGTSAAAPVAEAPAEAPNENNQPAEQPADTQETTECPAKSLILGFVHTALETGVITGQGVMDVLVDCGLVTVTKATNPVDKKFDDREINDLFAGRC